LVWISSGSKPTSNAPPGPKRKKKESVTIIIVGETGVGKTAFMDLLANVCAGRSVNQFCIEHNRNNESNLDRNQSQTNEAIMYTFDRRDGVQLRILDTPGLCDTRGLEKDKEHKRSIAEKIRAQVQTLDAVIIMANGTVERVGPGIEYALYTLASMFPRSIADNIGFMLTNVPDPLSFNFQQDTLPPEVRNAEVWAIQNPVAQFTKYQESKANSRYTASKLQRVLQSNYENTMETLTEFFTWLDERKSQPTSAIVDLYDMTTNIEAEITKVLSQIDQQEEKRMSLKRLENDYDRYSQVSSLHWIFSIPVFFNTNLF
jgi:AIG1 family